MKKFLILVMSIILFGQTALASGTYCKLDFSDGESDKQAGKILYEYVLKELNKTPEEAKDFARNILPWNCQLFLVYFTKTTERV